MLTTDKLLEELGLSESDIALWQGKLFVVKAGGEVIDSSTQTLQEDLCALQPAKLVVAYGGQKDISTAMQANGYEPKFTPDGLRITDKAAMEIFLGVVPEIGKKVAHGSNTQLFLPSMWAVKKHYPNGDLGYVGEPVKPLDEVKECIEKGKKALLAPVGLAYSKEEGYNGLWNCNADAVAGVTAVHLWPEELIFLTNVDGIKVDGQVEHYLSVKEVQDATEKGYITSGMQQKVFYALLPLLEGTINHVHIANGLKPHALLHALAHKPFDGTVIYR